MSAHLLRSGSAARAWLFDRMLPLWTGPGFDPAAAQFVEALSPQGEPLPLPRRTLVQARQMAVCAAGGTLGWSGPWAERATAAGEALLARGRGARGDWIYSFDVSGAPADRRTDLYTQAFVILGFAEAGRALGRGDFLAAAVATRERLEAAWADPSGGFREGEIAPHAGRQNPHMHLLEAFLALHTATQDPADLRAARAIGERLLPRLVVGDRLPEAFDVDWRVRDAEGAAPGHQFEWAWLLERLRQAGGVDTSKTAQALAGFGERFGVDQAGFAVDAVRLDGRALAPTARLWPQAERLKAALAALGPEPSRAAREASAALSAYLDPGVPGAWLDLRLPDGTFEPGAAPASSGYHIVGALQALIARD